MRSERNNLANKVYEYETKAENFNYVTFEMLVENRRFKKLFKAA